MTWSSVQGYFFVFWVWQQFNLGAQTRSKFFFITCTAKMETKPSSGTLWYPYKELEKWTKSKYIAQSHIFLSLHNLFRTPNEMVRLQLWNGWHRLLVAKEAMFMPTALLVSEFLLSSIFIYPKQTMKCNATGRQWQYFTFSSFTPLLLW